MSSHGGYLDKVVSSNGIRQVIFEYPFAVTYFNGDKVDSRMLTVDEIASLKKVSYSSKSKSVKQYDDLRYIRASINDRAIVDAVRKVLGLKEGESVPLVFDGKVTPVVVLNDNKFLNGVYSTWVKSWEYDYTSAPDWVVYVFIDDYGYLYYTYNSGNFRTVKDGNVQDSGVGWLNYNNIVFNVNTYLVPFVDDSGVNSMVKVYYKGVLKTIVDTGLLVGEVSYVFFSGNGKYMVVVGNKFYCFEGVI